MGLSVSGVLGYFVIKFLLKRLWNISDDITDNIGEELTPTSGSEGNASRRRADEPDGDQQSAWRTGLPFS